MSDNKLELLQVNIVKEKTYIKFIFYCKTPNISEGMIDYVSNKDYENIGIKKYDWVKCDNIYRYDRIIETNINGLDTKKCTLSISSPITSLTTENIIYAAGFYTRVDICINLLVPEETNDESKYSNQVIIDNINTTATTTTAIINNNKDLIDIIPYLQYNLYTFMQRSADPELNPLERTILMALWNTHCIPPNNKPIVFGREFEDIPLIKIAVKAYDYKVDDINDALLHLFKKKYIVVDPSGGYRLAF